MPRAISWPNYIRTLARRHASIALMLLAQLVSAVLATIGRVLRTGHGDPDAHALGTSEILIFMMGITALLSWTHTYLSAFRRKARARSKARSQRIETGEAGDAEEPYNPPRTLMLARSIAGFAGIWGFYYSLHTLSLSTATILNFLSPVLAVLLLAIFPANATPTSLPRTQLHPAKPQSAAVAAALLTSLLGATLALEPWHPSSPPLPPSPPNNTSSPNPTQNPNTSQSQIYALLATTLAILGSSTSYALLSHISTRAAPSHTVAYFATTSSALSALILLLTLTLVPETTTTTVPLRIPRTPTQWTLIIALGVGGYAMHGLMTASLAVAGKARAPRTLNLVYTQIVFAMAADRLVWGVAPDASKYAGAALIVASAVFVASGSRGTERDQEYGYALVGGDVYESVEEGEASDVELDVGKERVEIASGGEP